MYRNILTLLITLTVCLAGCSTLPQSAPLPQGMQVEKLSAADPNAPFALDKEGKRLALLKKGLQILDLKTGKREPITAERPTVLSFAPDGRLAAAFEGAGQATVRLYDRSGRVIKETAVAGKIPAMLWRNDKELLVAALTVKRFSFGGHLETFLYRWDGVSAPAKRSLHNVTVRPLLAKGPEKVLTGTFSMNLSPFGDEVALSRLKDPPAFTPYLQFVTHHLDSGGERLLADVPIGSGGPLYAPDGEKVLVGSESVSRWVSLADGRDATAFPVSGSSIALSPGGSYALLDGHLFHDAREIALFPAESSGAFSADGKSLVINYGDALYLLSGLRDAAPPPLPANLERILELRRLLSLGLITRQELDQALERTPKQ